MIHDAVISAGFPVNHITHVDSETELIKTLDAMLQKGDVVLVKGAHSLRMDNVVQALEMEE